MDLWMGLTEQRMDPIMDLRTGLTEQRMDPIMDLRTRLTEQRMDPIMGLRVIHLTGLQGELTELEAVVIPIFNKDGSLVSV